MLCRPWERRGSERLSNTQRSRALSITRKRTCTRIYSSTSKSGRRPLHAESTPQLKWCKNSCRARPPPLPCTTTTRKRTTTARRAAGTARRGASIPLPPDG
ncbi:unnamed protein product [Ectocarpus sp. 12 AP-2014]